MLSVFLCCTPLYQRWMEHLSEPGLQCGLIRNPQAPHVSPSYCWDRKSVYHSWLCAWVLGTELSGPHSHTASSLLTEPSLHPPKYISKYIYFFREFVPSMKRLSLFLLKDIKEDTRKIICAFFPTSPFSMFMSFSFVF